MWLYFTPELNVRVLMPGRSDSIMIASIAGISRSIRLPGGYGFRIRFGNNLMLSKPWMFMWTERGVVVCNPQNSLVKALKSRGREGEDSTSVSWRRPGEDQEAATQASGLFALCTTRSRWWVCREGLW